MSTYEWKKITIYNYTELCEGMEFPKPKDGDIFYYRCYKYLYKAKYKGWVYQRIEFGRTLIPRPLDDIANIPVLGEYEN